MLVRRARARGLLAAASVTAVLTLTGVSVTAANAAPKPGPAPSSSSASPVDVGKVLPTSPTAYLFGETLAKLSGRDLEITFMGSIIAHHQAAITMAKLELERGKSPDIRTHAENIISQQQSEIDQYTRWLKQWYGLTPEQARQQAPAEARAEMQKMDQETQQRINELKAVGAGIQFDIAFVQRIIPHHNAGIIEFLEPQARAPHAELRVAAATGITNQEAEIADFRTWLSVVSGER